ncbi:transcription factor IIIC subunit delta N-term-domain-containing protein, partial [Multifurca ochricompacta]
RNMEHVTIYAASSVPAAASHPTISCLQWTEDGQLLFVTKTAVYILTPDFGVNNSYGPFSTTASKLKDSPGGFNACGWFRTVLELDRRSFYHWPMESQDWDNLVTGSLDVSIKAVVASPSFLSADAGCVLAVVSTNLELSLWCSLRNQLAGQWVKLQDATHFLQSLGTVSGGSRLQQALRSQVVCCSWSRQPDFDNVPASVLDGSLLAVGNKAGSVLLLRFTRDSGPSQYLEHIQTIVISEQWVTHLTWLPWTRTRVNECLAALVYCTSDGTVGSIQVTRTISIETRAASRYGSDPVIATSLSHSKTLICEADDRMITALSFIEPRDRDMNPVVVIFRPGVVHLWTEARDGGGGSLWSGLRFFLLHRQGISRGSSMFYPPSGLVYSPEHDIIVLSLVDGSFHVIYDVSTSPTVKPPEGLTGPVNNYYTSSGLSSVSRRVFLRVDGGVVPHAEMNQISGMVSFAGFPIVSWAHERSILSDFSYKHEARHNSTLVVSKMLAEDDRDDDAVLRMLTQITQGDDENDGDDDDILTRLYPRLHQACKILRARAIFWNSPLPPPPPPTLFGDPSSGFGFGSSYRRRFCDGITRRLFGSDVLLRLRLKLAIADFCWKSTSNPEIQREYETIARGLLNAISHRVLGALIQEIASAIDLLTRDDLSFVLRVVIQCLLPGTPQELSAEAQKLANEISTSGGRGTQEQCPACGLEIPLTDIATAACSRGHRWSRCSVTSFILSTTMVRTCLGCARKAFLPTALSPHLFRATGRGWVIQELLNAARRCLFCGNNFATLI